MGGQLTFEYEVTNRLQGKPYLEPIFSHDLAHWLREYDPNFFLVWNARRKKYEVHCLNHIGSTYGFDVPNNKLDSRVEVLIQKCNIRTRGEKIFREIDDWNEKLRKQMERRRRDEIQALAGEIKPIVSKLAWEGV